MRKSDVRSRAPDRAVVRTLKNYRTVPAGRCEVLLAVAISLGLSGCIRTPGADSDGKGVATVSWVAPTRNSDGSLITDLAGYTIFYGTSPNKLSASIDVKDPQATVYTVKKLRSGTTYYFSIVAFTSAGMKSDASPTVSRVIP